MSQTSKIEQWRVIPESEGRYEVSDLGRVRKAGGQVVRGSFDRYAFVRFKVGDRWPKRYVHRLVAEAFVPGRSDEREHVNHIDGDKANNSADNLEWVTQGANNRHAYRTGLVPAGGGHHWSKLTAEQVDEIRRLRGVETQHALAARFGVSNTAISAIQLGKAWNTKERCADVC